MPGSVSSSLLQRAVQLDGNAWERLVSLYYPLIYGWCRRYGLQPEDSAVAATVVVFGDMVRSVFNA